MRQQGQSDRHTISQTSSNTSIGYNNKERIEISTLKSQNINDVDNFLEKFERLAVMSDVPKNEWGRILTSKLDSQFDKVINAIPYESMKDYEVIVGEIRKQFALDSTYYRNEFQSLRQGTGESTMGFSISNTYCLAGVLLAISRSSSFSSTTAPGHPRETGMDGSAGPMKIAITRRPGCCCAKERAHRPPVRTGGFWSRPLPARRRVSSSKCSWIMEILPATRRSMRSSAATGTWSACSSPAGFRSMSPACPRGRRF